MKCKRCREEIEVNRFGFWKCKCSLEYRSPEPEYESSKGEKGDDKSNLKSKAKASLTSVNENKRDINRKSPRNPESLKK